MTRLTALLDVRKDSLASYVGRAPEFPARDLQTNFPPIASLPLNPLLIHANAALLLQIAMVQSSAPHA